MWSFFVFSWGKQMGNLKIAARLLNRVPSKRLSTTFRKKNKKKAIMVELAWWWALIPIPYLAEIQS